MDDTMDPVLNAYCEAHGFQYYGLYEMWQVAIHLCDVSATNPEDVDTSSIKRWIKSRRLGSVKHGEKGVRVLGYQIAAFHMKNIVEVGWDGKERRTRQQPFRGVDRRSA